MLSHLYSWHCFLLFCRQVETTRMHANLIFKAFFHDSSFIIWMRVLTLVGLSYWPAVQCFWYKSCVHRGHLGRFLCTSKEGTHCCRVAQSVSASKWLEETWTFIHASNSQIYSQDAPVHVQCCALRGKKMDFGTLDIFSVTLHAIHTQDKYYLHDLQSLTIHPWQPRDENGGNSDNEFQKH